MARIQQVLMSRLFAFAGIDDSAVGDAILKAIDETGAEGFRKFKRRAKELLGDKRIRDAQLEFVFRNHVMKGYTDAAKERHENPVVNDVFPYAEIIPIKDARTTPEHAAMARLGIGGSSVYRCDDPVFRKYRPSWGLTCRCGSNYLTIEAAARAGVSEAKEWQRTGRPPAHPAWVRMPPFDAELTPCEILGVIGEVSYLLKALERDDDQEWVLDVLGEIGPAAKQARTPVAALLNHRLADVREAAADCLERIGAT